MDTCKRKWKKNIKLIDSIKGWREKHDCIRFMVDISLENV